MTITKITTRGYSGPGTQFQYMPPGELTVAGKTSVGAMTVTHEFAKYLVASGIAEVVSETIEAHFPEGIYFPIDNHELEEMADFELSGVHQAYIGPERWANMNRAELLQWADDHGIAIPSRRAKKADLIALITESV